MNNRADFQNLDKKQVVQQATIWPGKPQLSLAGNLLQGYAMAEQQSFEQLSK
jgi:hypothetical protein